jgi:hypothetical protein
MTIFSSLSLHMKVHKRRGEMGVSFSDAHFIAKSNADGVNADMLLGAGVSVDSWCCNCLQNGAYQYHKLWSQLSSLRVC